MKTFYGHSQYWTDIPCAKADAVFRATYMHHELEFKVKKRSTKGIQFWLHAEPYYAIACDRIAQPHICGLRLSLTRRTPNGRYCRTYFKEELEWHKIYPCAEITEGIAFYDQFKTYDLKPYLVAGVL